MQCWKRSGRLLHGHTDLNSCKNQRLQVKVCSVLETRLTKNWNKMVSVLQNVKATMAWRKHQLLGDFDEDESPVPDKFKRRTSLSSLNTIRMSLRKRVPLQYVELNYRRTPTWESLEARKKCQTLQTIKRTAKNAFGTVSQKIQKSCQSQACSMVTFPAESISSNSATSSTKKRSNTPHNPCHRKSVTPTASSKGTPRSSKRALLEPTRASEHKEGRGFSSWLGKGAVSLRRSRRAAALKSPYSSPASASRKMQHAISNYYYLMAQNLQSARRPQNFLKLLEGERSNSVEHLVPRQRWL
ncbi:PREDICTED: protein FAM64A isoform X1 [Calidris pugnax]|uniref:protein FAM64A isoform X1 n=2 Tax=Calidris pugnax TaxID=198806 RepID=UPI00071CE5DC|nr:PREDICTED: protein FAM64A isoform X1 [Calidris pugnax]